MQQLKAVAKEKSALERLVSIMEYKDPEYFIYRCFSVSGDITKEGDYYVANLTGDVAWSCTKWFETEEKPEELIVLKYEDGWKCTRPVFGTAHYITLDLLCKKLEIGLELYSEESGCCFQEHYHVDANGNILIKDCVEWTEDWWDEENDCERDEPVYTGGFDDYCCFAHAKEIFGELEMA